MIQLGPDNRVLCLDWDSRHVRIVLARCRRQVITILGAHSTRIPEDVETAPALGKFIRGVLDEQGIRAKRCVVDIPRDQAVLNTLILPVADTDELASLVKFQIARELPFSLDEASVDFVTGWTEESHRRGSDGEDESEEHPTAEVHVAAVRNEVLEYYQQVCQTAGLELQRVGLRPHANLLALKHMLPGGGHGRMLFVEVGPSLTEIDVVRDGRLTFSRAASVIVPDPEDEGGAYRLDGDSGASEGEADLESAISDLLVEINRSIEAYRATDPGASFSRILVGGSSGIETELVRAIQTRFDTPTQEYDPSGTIEIRADDPPPLVAMGPVLGLAIGETHASGMKFDFIHPKKPGDEARAKRKKIPVIAATVLVFLLAGGVAWWQISGRPVREQKHALVKQIQEAKSWRRNFEKQVTEFSNVRKWQSTQVKWIDELKTIVGYLPGEKVAYLTRLYMNNKGDLDLKLQSTRNDAATRLAKKLADVRRKRKVRNKVEEIRAYAVAVGRTMEQKPGSNPLAAKYKWNSPLNGTIRPVKDAYVEATKKKRRRRSSSR